MLSRNHQCSCIRVQVTMLGIKRSACIAPEVILRNPSHAGGEEQIRRVWNPGQTLPEV